MSDLVQVILLGIVEGITEFLPISSTGHLLIAEKLGLGERSDVFNVVIQAGAILAVTVIYWPRIKQLLHDLVKGVLIIVHCVTDKKSFSWLLNELEVGGDFIYALKLILAFLITAVLGLIVTKLGFKLPTELTPVAWALVIGGVWMIGAEWFAAKRPDYARIAWAAAIVVGVAQVIAGVFPGTSRSAATIFSAMLVGGANRVIATEFAFLVGIPTMYAASVLELFKAMKAGDFHNGAENWSDLGIAFVVSTVVAFVAVKWLLRYIQSHRFTVFAVYRIALGAALLLFLPIG